MTADTDRPSILLIGRACQIGGILLMNMPRLEPDRKEDIRKYLIATLEHQGRDFGVCELCDSLIPPKKFVLHHTKYDGATIKDIRIACQKCNLLPENCHLA